MPDRYTPQSFLKAILNPEMIRSEGTRFLLGMLNGYRHGGGIDVMSEDWDNLIILDACRYDYFEQVQNLDPDLGTAISKGVATSKGTSSWEFIEQNFRGRELHDTIYVTANPFFDDIEQEVFFTIESTLDTTTEHGLGWELGIDQVHPEQVVNLARKVHETYPHKRLIVHFMQPHQPFIGETADKIRTMVPGDAAPDDYTEFKQDHIHYYLAREYVTIEQFRKAYTETLEFVLEYVEKLLSTLDGKSVITADHGELLGERILGREAFGHKSKWECPELREVPWYIIESDTRRHIEPDDPMGYDELGAQAREQHLQALGYH
jgi:predicted AlkP superfamily pyrophosphatase or phosphodiesterase